MVNLLDLRKKEETETKKARKISWKIRRNVVFSAILLIGVTFSIVTVIRAAAPDPGHTLAEIDLENIENTALSTWAGTSNLTTLGTITTGTWNGTAIDDLYIASSAIWNAKQNALGFTPEDFSNKGIAGGYASLDGAGKVPTSQLPALAIGDTFVVADEPSMLAVIAETGDVAVRVDLNKSFILAGSNPLVLADWQELLTPTDTVLSVNGYTGAVALTPSDLGLVIGTNVQAWDADLDSWSAIAPASVDKNYVGLGNVENTTLSTWAGTANLTTLGTITTGDWNATPIADAYIASSATWNAKQDALTYEIKSGKVISVTENVSTPVIFTTVFGTTPDCSCSVDLSGSGVATGGMCVISAGPVASGFSVSWDDTIGGPAKTENIQWICTDVGNP